MPLNAREMKAITWYIKDRNLKPQLSAPPQMHFKNESGDTVTVDLAAIVLEYNAWNDQDKKERAREKRVENTRRLIKRAF